MLLLVRCNFDEVTAGYIPMEDRFMRILVLLGIAVVVAIIGLVCCKLCCCRHNHNTPQPQQHPQQQKPPPRRRHLNMKGKIAIVVGFVCIIYILSFFIGNLRLCLCHVMINILIARGKWQQQKI